MNIKDIEELFKVLDEETLDKYYKKNVPLYLKLMINLHKPQN